MPSPRSLGFCLLILLVSPSLVGQDTASLTGTVTDATNATITDAQIIVGNVGKGINRITRTNAAGKYLVSGLPPVHYDIAISAPGFATYNVKNVVLGVAQNARLDAKLRVGTASLQITVAGEDLSTVETQSSELAGTVTGREITQLQLNGRDFTQLIALVPGVSNQSSEDQGIGAPHFSVNGGRLEYNNWELDGGDMLDNGSNTTLNITPSIDSISEVRVLTSIMAPSTAVMVPGRLKSKPNLGRARFTATFSNLCAMTCSTLATTGTRPERHSPTRKTISATPLAADLCPGLVQHETG